VHLAGLWEFPGGKIHGAESHADALRREMREELDADVDVLDLVFETTHAYPERIVTLFFYRCVLKDRPRPLLGQTETLVIADDPDFSNAPFLKAKSVSVGVELLPLILSRSLKVTTITIDSPQVTVIRNSAGRWNYSSLGSSGVPAGDVAFKKLEWKNGRVIVGSTDSRTRSIYDHVDVTMSHASLTSTFPVIATGDLDGGGHFTLAGNVGRLNREDASLTPFDGRLNINGLNLAARGFLNPSVGLGGLLDVDATIASKNDEREVRGTARILKALLVAGGSPSARPVTVGFQYEIQPPEAFRGPGAVHAESRQRNRSPERNLRLQPRRVLGRQHQGCRRPHAGHRSQSFLPGIGIHFPKGTTLAAGTLNAT
jgi:mutator protein MutT